MQKISLCLLLLCGALILGNLQAQEAPAPTPANAAAALAAAANASEKPAAKPSPVGTWSWFVGPDITFGADNSVVCDTGFGTWKWTDEDKRELRVDWKSSGYVDTLTLSEDGKHLQGRNNANDEVSGDRMDTPAVAPGAKKTGPGSAAFSGTDPASPVGVWHWFVGRDQVFHDDGTVTYPGNHATWKWVDQAKRTLKVEWQTLPFVDELTLSEDGKKLEGTNNVDASKVPNNVAAERVVSPLGIWRMNKGANITFKEDHNAAFGRTNSGFWYWTDEPKRKLKVEWYTIPFVDNLTLSEDGNRIEGANHQGDEVAGMRISGALPAVKPADGKAAATPVGTWTWFVGPDLTFAADGSVTGENRTARWSWTNQDTREFQIEWTGVQSGFVDHLKLSDDGNHIQGGNNQDTNVTGDRIVP